ncbi:MULTISPECIES: hypothetical protein [unclassified Chryseobacterium]|uniref:hypothetical protein n=1 Tax=unclassified Chryseobacterium TaxID=2593645 RepID=UPI002853608A|nr:hypothetical protein [Chryseobacterium sp. CFS7]MDR4892656.1 hypothetical protein [Chryseobacterium sp. CFS7]
MSDKAILEINLNEEYKIKIEKGNSFNESIFKNVYLEALRNTIGIVRHSEVHKDSKYDDFNNIIAFTGERGKGKTSSMISFRDSLVNKECRNNIEFFKNDNENYLKDKTFAEIDVIDPSLFRGGESLFEIILAKMFQKFQIEIKKDKCELNQVYKRELIEHFQKTFQNLQIIISDRKDLYKKESIEALSKLAISSNLREDFNHLVKYYLEHFEKKEFLVIAIDDFDVNIEAAYKMLEDIRQFLIQPKVILLISCKIEQLNEAIAIQYKDLKIENQVSDKAKRYIDKLIPFSRRIFLPDIQKLDKIRFKVLIDKEVIFNGDEGNFNELIINLIFEKLHLLQTNNQLNRNFILPNTIRETQNFINTLLNSQSLDKLRKYTINEVYKLDDKYRNIIDELENVSDDLFLISVLRKFLRLNFEYRPRDRKTVAYTKLSNANIKSSISLGDIFFLIEEFESTISIDDYESFEFLDLFKLYFSIRLLDLDKNLVELEFTRYGFVNKYMYILSKEKNGRSRDFIEFEYSLDWCFEELEENEAFILGLFVFYLGEGNEDYRHKMDKDIFVERYTKGVISPFAIWHNMYNIEILSSILNFDINNEFTKLNKEWFENSIFIKQLYNPSFTLKLFEYINEFRLKEVKDSLPNNYFDDICLLFIYGTIYSLNKLENLYKVKGLVNDYIKYPVINELLKHFNNLDYSNKKVSELNEIYDIHKIFEDEDFVMINNLKDIINDIYELSRGVDQYKLSLVTKNYLLTFLNDLNKAEKFTSRFITYRIDKLRDFDDTEEIVNYLEEIKSKFNDPDPDYFTENKNDLQNYLINLING